MKLISTLLLSLAFVIFVIGVHRIFYVDGLENNGVMNNYWIIMLSVLTMMVYRYTRQKKA